MPTKNRKAIFTMLTYDLSKAGKNPLYEYIYTCIKNDILNGKLVKGEKLPSKRSFAAHEGVSMITAENAYEQLLCEGYIYSLPRKGYYVADTGSLIRHGNAKSSGLISSPPKPSKPDEALLIADFCGSRALPDSFPFATWARLMRETISEKSEALMERSEGQGKEELRIAIAQHLRDFRGMEVDPDCIVIGAGTEYLYGLLLRLLGNDQIYCVEDPGYQVIEKVYTAGNARCLRIPMDEYGMTTASLDELCAGIIHISPTHHFPTGITMPITRRYELLNWAYRAEGRYIIEDDYDSEFRLTGRPIPSLFGTDTGGRVIYMNTFSKTLAHTIRVSYMILPPQLMRLFSEKLGFYSCTVSNFEQYTLARFLSGGYFEKHLNRSRIYFSKRREALISAIKSSPLGRLSEIIEKDSGLHFLLKLDTALSDEVLGRRLLEQGVKIYPLSKYYADSTQVSHIFICNYSGLDTSRLDEALCVIADSL